MKPQIFNRNLLLGVAATCCCLALFAPEPIAGSQFAITGEFMGSKSIDGEQVLLFKLPKSISTHVEEQLEERGRWVEQANPEAAPSQAQVSSAHEQPLKLLQPGTTKSALSRLSLTLPSSQELAPSSTGYVYSSMPQLVARRPLETSLADILSLAESNNSAAIEQTDISGTNQSVSWAGVDGFGEQPLDYAEPSSEEKIMPVAAAANLSSIEAQLQRLLLERQRQPESYSNSSTEALLGNQHTGGPRDTGTVWVSQNQPAQQRHQNMTSTGGQEEQVAGGILGKLAASSPELLLRLRTLLHRAALYSEPGSGFQHANSSSLANFAARKRGGQQQDNTLLLDSFLGSQNVSSHDEIKIPLVVIAMPRIISLKRNQFGAKQARQGAASGFGETGAGSAADRQPASHTGALRQLLAELNATHQAAGSASSRLATVRIQQHLLDGAGYQGPQHTMAPYARHFIEPSAPLAYQEQPEQATHSQDRSHLAGEQLKQAARLTTPSLAGSTSRRLLQVAPTSRLQYFEPSAKLSHLSSGALFRGPELGAGNRQHRSTGHQLNVEQVAAALNARPAARQQAAELHGLYYPQPLLSTYLSAPPNQNLTLTGFQHSSAYPQVQGHQQQPFVRPHNSDMPGDGPDELAAAQNRDSLLLAKLRPLFTANPSSASSSSSSSSPLSSSQLLSLMSPPATTLARRQDGHPELAAPLRKSPEMMLMIL